PIAGVLRDIVLRDITALDGRETSSIVGLPGAPVQRVTLERVRIETAGGGAHDGAPVGERPDAYPQNTMLGVLPAWGLYARHVQGLVMGEVEFVARQPDARAMIIRDDVS